MMWQGGVPARQRPFNQHYHIMKETLTSLLRHALTALAGAGTFMAGRGLIAPEDATAVDASGATISEALIVIVVAVLMRLLMSFTGKFFAAQNGKGNGSGAMLLLLGATMFLGFASSSCSLADREAVPVRASYTDKAGNVYAYDPQSGVSVRIIEAAK